MVEAVFRQGDLNHITGDIHYIGLLLRKRKTVLTIHDLGSVHRLRGLRKSLFLFLWYWLPIRRSALVTVISESTKDDLLQHIKVDPQKIRVVYDCVSEEFNSFPKELISTEPIILQLGTGANKNLERVSEALRGVPCHLRIVGRLDDKQTAVLERCRINFSCVSDIPNEQVVEEYQKSDLLVFVSTYEGFGLPILEAQATGRPVITSSILSMPEVAGDSACLVDPFDVSSIRKGILNVINDSAYREELVKRGFENVKRFQPDNIAEQYADIYYELLGRKTGM